MQCMYRGSYRGSTLLRNGLTDELDLTGTHNGNFVSHVSVAPSFQSFTSGLTDVMAQT